MESYKKNEYLPFPWNDEMYNDTELGIFYRLNVCMIFQQTYKKL